MIVKYTKLMPISLKGHAEFDERWVQDRISEDPSILGLGELILRDRERIQPKAGRLDLLLQDPDSSRRYEVEIQLGVTDESHIIRTLEYWDIERKRYPQYDHAAVIIAEEITGRFHNVIGLFNGYIPLIAIQMRAFSLGDAITLAFTKVLDEVILGEDDDESFEAVADRAYWETKASKQTLQITDELFALLKSLDRSLELKYTVHYIGLARNGRPNNFALFKPKKEWVRIELKLEKSDETQRELESAGLDVMDYNTRWGQYRLRVTEEDVKKHRDLILDLFTRSYNRNR